MVKKWEDEITPWTSLKLRSSPIFFFGHHECRLPHIHDIPTNPRLATPPPFSPHQVQPTDLVVSGKAVTLCFSSLKDLEKKDCDRCLAMVYLYHHLPSKIKQNVGKYTSSHGCVLGNETSENVKLYRP